MAITKPYNRISHSTQLALSFNKIGYISAKDFEQAQSSALILHYLSIR